MYNLNSFGGRYVSKELNDVATEYVDISKGAFPLSMSTYMSYEDGAKNGSHPFVMELTELPTPICAGQKIEIFFYFPMVSITYASSYTYEQSFYVKCVADGDTVAACKVDYDNADGSISYTGDFLPSISIGWENILADDRVLELLYDDNSKVVGFHLTGTLLYDVTGFSYSQTFSHDLSSPPTGYCYVTFNSVDDLQITVTSEPVFTLTARDLYRKINGKPTKLTLYKKLNGKLVKVDEHTKEVTNE